MTLFVTSSPYVNDADRAILSNDNEFIDRIRAVLPPCPRALFIAADPQNREDTCRFGADTVAAFSNFTPEQVKMCRSNADKLSRKALWSHFIKYYYQAYDVALRKAECRKTEKA